MRTMLLALAFISSSFINTTAAQQSFSRGPYCSYVTQHSFAISWRTKNPAKSFVEYGRTSNYGSVAFDTNVVIDHLITLEGLSPLTSYHYRVISGDTTAEYIVHTVVPAGTPFEFAAYGDTRTDHYNHVKVLTTLQSYHPLMAIHTGDLVESSNDANWDDYFNDLCVSTNVGQTIPIFSAFGNHEGTPTQYYQIMDLPYNNPDSSEGYYSFDYGDVHIVCVANYGVSYALGSTQYAWLANDLSKTHARYKIVFMHLPPYSSGNHGRDANVLDARNVLCPVFEQNKVNIVFSGHDHDYERSNPMNGTTYIVAGGGGAPLYNPAANNSWTAYKEMAFHFCRVVVDTNALRVFMIRSDGAVRDSFSVSGSPAAGLGRFHAVMPPKDFELLQNFPNPFNPSTTIDFNVSVRSKVRITVYNILGERLLELMNDEIDTGEHSVVWNADAASGLYFCRLEAISLENPNRTFTDVKKMILLR